MGHNDTDSEVDSRTRGKNSSRGASVLQIVFIVMAIVGCVFVLLCLGMAVLLVPAMNAAVKEAEGAAQRSQSQLNLKQIGLAMHIYHDAYRSFPAGKFARSDGVEVYSWQVSIPPYMEQEVLYNQLDFNESWDSARNRAVYSTAVPAYLHPSVREVSDASGMPLLHYAGNSHLFLANQCVTLAAIRDGSSNTIMVGEVVSGLKPWGMPGNVRDPADGVGPASNQFQGPINGTTEFLFCDGTVRSISNDIDPAILRALATPAGHEPIDREMISEF